VAAFLLLHLTAVPLGNTVSMLLALAVSVGWSILLLMLARRAGSTRRTLNPSR
jgi:hypothetical protein